MEDTGFGCFDTGMYLEAVQYLEQNGARLRNPIKARQVYERTLSLTGQLRFNNCGRIYSLKDEKTED